MPTTYIVSRITGGVPVEGGRFPDDAPEAHAFARRESGRSEGVIYVSVDEGVTARLIAAYENGQRLLYTGERSPT